MAEGKRIIVIGGSGYLGQHLLDALARETGDPPYILAFTHHRSIPPPKLIEAISPVLSFRVELLSGEGFESISTAFGQPDVVVNCAAMSIPRACEVDPVTAMSTNMPTSLISWLSNCKGNNTLLIHLSTDQVYEGSKSFYKEEDETAPVNVYGKSKEAAEQFISEHCSNFAILRSSIIFGPQAISPVSKSLPIQWIDYSLSRGEEIEFFHDEFRCPIYVKDVVNAILALIEKWIAERNQIKLILNIGGPDRLSRVQMAEAVAECRGYARTLIKSVSSLSVNRGFVSPPDISMHIGRLVEVLGINPISFKDGVKLTLENFSLP